MMSPQSTAPLNTQRVGYFGVTLVGSSVGAMAQIITSASCGPNFPTVKFILALAGIVIGCALCYFARPFTVPDSKG